MAMDGKFGVYILPWPPINWRSRPTATLERAFRVVGLGVVGRFSSSLEPENLPQKKIQAEIGGEGRGRKGGLGRGEGLLDGTVVVCGLVNKPRGPVTNHLARYSD